MVDSIDKAWQASRNCFSKIYGDNSLFWKGLTITAWMVEDEGKYPRQMPRTSDKLKMKHKYKDNEVFTLFQTEQTHS